MGLLLSQKLHEPFFIKSDALSENILVTVVDVWDDPRGNGVNVKLYFQAPDDVVIDRSAMHHKKLGEQWDPYRQAWVPIPGRGPHQGDQPGERDRGPVRPSDAYKKDGGR